MKEEKNSLGVASFVTSILSILLSFMPIFGLPLGIIAVVCANKQRKIKSNGLTTSGFIMGIIGICLNGLMLFFGMMLTLLF